MLSSCFPKKSALHNKNLCMLQPSICLPKRLHLIFKWILIWLTWTLLVFLALSSFSWFSSVMKKLVSTVSTPWSITSTGYHHLINTTLHTKDTATNSSPLVKEKILLPYHQSHGPSFLRHTCLMSILKYEPCLRVACHSRIGVQEMWPHKACDIRHTCLMALPTSWNFASHVLGS